MKGFALYVVAGVVGAAAGTVGMGSYRAIVVGVEPGSAAVADTAHAVASADHAAEPTTPESAGRERVEPGSVEPESVEPEGAEEARLASAAEVEPPADPAAPEGRPGGEGPDVGVAGAEQFAPAPTNGADPSGDADAAERARQNYPRLARIFAAMKPAEAAPVLAQLDDEQLEGILLAMQGRNAAPILAEMDPERVAAISRRVLGSNR